MRISTVIFSHDNATAQIKATETGTIQRGIAGIYVNGMFMEGSNITFAIDEGVKHLEMKAVNNDGDYSKTLIRRVPGWSEIVSSLYVKSCNFNNSYTTATITAVATSDIVAGIYVNGDYFAGNPVYYKIPRNTSSLNIQAVNQHGDLSPLLKKVAPTTST